MKLPERIPQHITETASYKIFANTIPDSWIIREVTERDYGIDCYIEICNENYITGKMLSIQLKGEQNIEIHSKDKEPYVACYGIKSSSFNYWYKLPVVTLFVFVDIHAKVVYFQNIKQYIRKNYLEFKDEKLNNIKIPVIKTLSKETSHILLNIICDYEMMYKDYVNLVESFILGFEENMELLSNHLCRDCFLSLGEEDNDDIKIINLYRKLNQLANVFDIPWKIKSLDEMISEGRKMFGRHAILFEKQVAEFVENVLPIITSLIDKIIELITIKESAYWEKTNHLIWVLVKERNIKRILKVYFYQV